MKKEGFNPAVVVETSPDNYQCWVKLHMEVGLDLQTVISKRLQKMYGGDSGAVAAGHSGRLAGFTNRKPVHVQDNGLYPFAKLIESSGLVARDSKEIVDFAIGEIKKQRETFKEVAMQCKSKGFSDVAIDRWWASVMEKLRKRNEGDTSISQSELDFGMARLLAMNGAGFDSIVSALERNSDDLELRKGKYKHQYCELTAAKAVVFTRELNNGADRDVVFSNLSGLAKDFLKGNRSVDRVSSGLSM